MQLFAWLKFSLFVCIISQTRSVFAGKGRSAERLLLDGLKRAESLESNRLKGVFYQASRNYDTGGTLSEYRCAQLQQLLARTGGDVQGYYTLTYSEYTLLNKTTPSSTSSSCIPSNVVNLFRQFHAKLIEKEKELSDRHPILGETIQIELIKDMLAKEAKEKRSGMPTHKMVLDCKLLMYSLFVEGGLGSWLNIFSFINSWYWIRSKYHSLINIHLLSKVNSQELDGMVLDWISQQYQTNQGIRQAAHVSQFNSVLVQGAGPIGLYTALRFFQLGMHVTVVNERTEIYKRQQLVVLDPKWTEQLRFILGTMFDALFGGEHPPGKCMDMYNTVQTSINLVEDALKQRLVELASIPKNIDLKLLYQTAFKSIEFPTAKDSRFYALFSPLRKPTEEQIEHKKNLLAKHKQSQEGTSRLMQEKLTKMLEFLEITHGHKVGADDAIVDYNHTKITPQQQAQFELEGKVLELRATPKAAFHVLVLAGGANNQARDEYLGLAKQRSWSELYGSAVLLKGDAYKGRDLLPTQLYYKKWVRVSMLELKPFIEAQDFEHFLQNSHFVSDELKTKFKHLNALIVKGFKFEEDNDHQSYASDHTTNTTEEDNRRFHVNDDQSYAADHTVNTTEEQMLISVRETATLLYVGGSINYAIIVLLDWLEYYKGFEKVESKCDLYKKLADKLKRKWFSAVANKFINEKNSRLVNVVNTEISRVDPEKLNFDAHAVHVTTFSLHHYSVDKPAKLFTVPKGSAFVVAVGDAAFNSHFLSGEGMSNARFGVESIIKLFEKHSVGEISEVNLVENTLNVMEVARKQALETVIPFLGILEERQVNRMAAAKTYDIIQQKCKSGNEGLWESNQIYKLICQNDDKASTDLENGKFEFVMELNDGTQYRGTLTDTGKINIKRAIYDTLMDAALSLHGFFNKKY